ncbi:hypothetical protein N7540_006753 [Penicillium herquei]|nr:hypothetical protein N7540_006753 [Penicillium herquei]
MQYIISKDEDGVSSPIAINIILRESAEELRRALQSKLIGPCDKIKGLPLLDYTIGWPQGIEILLEFGADLSQITWRFLMYGPGVGLMDSDDIVASGKILLDAGATVGTEHMNGRQRTRWNSLIIESIRVVDGNPVNLSIMTSILRMTY